MTSYKTWEKKSGFNFIKPNGRPPYPERFPTPVAILGVLLGVFFLSGLACAYTNEQIADAIFWAEGGYKATYLYGIRSIPYKDEADARRICLNSIRNARKRWEKAGKPEDFITFMGRRYCPPTAHSLNSNWVKNVLFYLRKGVKNGNKSGTAGIRRAGVADSVNGARTNTARGMLQTNNGGR